MTHPALEPARIGHLDLPNRYVVAPMTRTSATADGIPTEEMADYYAEFAAGGFGLIVTEGTYTDQAHSQGYFHQPGLTNVAQVAGWREVVGRVHAAGGHIVAQLMHAGALSQGNPHRDGTVGPSAVQPLGEMLPDYVGDGPWPVPRALTRDELDEVVDGFVQAAANAREAGFDGVEVHGANGYLLDQFLTTYTNHRDDEYGGTAANRIRLTARIAHEIATAVDGDFVVGVRLSQTKVNDLAYCWPGGADEAEVIFRAVDEAGVSYLHVASEGRSWIDTARLPNGQTVTGVARRVAGVPVVANGCMHDPRQAERVLVEGHTDFVSIARGALVNPDLPCRLAKGADLEQFDRSMLHPRVTLANARAWQASRL